MALTNPASRQPVWAFFVIAVALCLSAAFFVVLALNSFEGPARALMLFVAATDFLVGLFFALLGKRRLDRLEHARREQRRSERSE